MPWDSIVIFRLFRLQSGNRRPGMPWDSIVIFRLFPSQSAYKRKKISTFSVPKTTNSARKMESPWHSNSLVFRPQKRGGGNTCLCIARLVAFSRLVACWPGVNFINIIRTRFFVSSEVFWEEKKSFFSLYRKVLGKILNRKIPQEKNFFSAAFSMYMLLE